MIPPILITGAARSGTSLTASAIHACGAFGGRMNTRPSRSASYENDEIRNGMVKPWLQDMGWDRMGQRPLPKIEKVKEVTPKQAPQWRERIRDVMKRHGYAGGAWFYKGAKACLMWPLWHGAFPEAKWVLVRRDTEAIVNSCMTTGFMRSYQTQEGWREWLAEHEKRWAEMWDAGLAMRETWPQNMIDGDLTDIRSIIEWLGLPWCKDKVKECIAPGLWGQRLARSA